MVELKLREATLDDRTQLEELFHEELEYHKNLMPNLFRIPEQVIDETWLKSIFTNKNTFLVVSEQDRTIIGAILYKIHVNPDDKIYKERKFGYIEELIVQQISRGQGIGTKLLNYAINELKNQGIKDIELNVWENNELGQRFFGKHKFKTNQRRMKLELKKKK